MEIVAAPVEGIIVPQPFNYFDPPAPYRQIFNDGEGGCDWNEFYAWVDGSGRIFWWSGSGCSCSSPSDDISTVDDLENGSRDGVLRAYKAWSESSIDGETELREALAAIR